MISVTGELRSSVMSVVQPELPDYLPRPVRDYLEGLIGKEQDNPLWDSSLTHSARLKGGRTQLAQMITNLHSASCELADSGHKLELLERARSLLLLVRELDKHGNDLLDCCDAVKNLAHGEPRESVLASAIDTLQRSSLPAAQQGLETLLTSAESYKVRMRVSFALSELPSTSTVIPDCADNQRDASTMNVLLKLARKEISAKVAANSLIFMFSLKSPPDDVIVSALSGLKHDDAIKELLHHFERFTPATQLSLARAMASLEDPRADASLVRNYLASKVGIGQIPLPSLINPRNQFRPSEELRGLILKSLSQIDFWECKKAVAIAHLFADSEVHTVIARIMVTNNHVVSQSDAAEALHACSRRSDFVSNPEIEDCLIKAMNRSVTISVTRKYSIELLRDCRTERALKALFRRASQDEIECNGDLRAHRAIYSAVNTPLGFELAVKLSRWQNALFQPRVRRLAIKMLREAVHVPELRAQADSLGFFKRPS